MSASLSSLIDVSADQPVPTDDDDDDVGGRPAQHVPADLLAALATVIDPRCRRGVRHQLVAVLGVSICAVLAGARSYVAIAEWAADLPVEVCRHLGIWRVPPSESAIRRVLQAVDPDLLNRVVTGWLSARTADTPPPPDAAGRRRWRWRWPIIAVDGKTVRGARTLDQASHQVRQVHLLAAFDPATGTVLAQTTVEGKTNEINAFAPLLDTLDITGSVVTADALHTQHRHAEYLHGRGAHYLLTVKANQPTLLAQLRSLPWTAVPTVDTTRDKAHGRRETRTLKITSVHLGSGIGFPHAALAMKIVRRRRPLGNARRWTTETVHLITDLTWDQVTAEQVADIARHHWGIENRLHWVRDVTYDEDRSQIRTGHGPAVMAALRNLAITVHRRYEHRRCDTAPVPTSPRTARPAATSQARLRLDNSKIKNAEALLGQGVSCEYVADAQPPPALMEEADPTNASGPDGLRCGTSPATGVGGRPCGVRKGSAIAKATLQ